MDLRDADHVTVYITKWAVTRGILVTKAEKPYRRVGCKRFYVLAQPPGLRCAQVLVLGREAFLTLPEARKNARVRFEAHLEKTRAENAYAEKAIALVRDGKGPAVHRKYTAVNKCKAF